MTIRNFDALFEPRTIVLIGASDRAGSVGEVVARNLLAGGFHGEIMFVNPHGRPIQGRTVFTSLAALPCVPELAVIVTPAVRPRGRLTDVLIRRKGPFLRSAHAPGRREAPAAASLGAAPESPRRP